MICSFIVATYLLRAGDDGPPRAPATRGEIKDMLEGSKRQTPRLPLPPLTEAEKTGGGGGALGVVNNGRMRRFYLPPELRDGGFARADEPNMSLGHTLRTEFFWIASRLNNCAYCLGHQEVKLRSAGLDDATLAALDGDWSGFKPDRRAAFAFVRKLTYEPHRVGADDLERLRPHFDDRQVLEIIHTCAANNAMNRWTGALAIPQEDHREFLTPSTSADRDRRTQLVPLSPRGESVCVATAERPAPGTRSEVEAALAACRIRTSRLPLVEAEKVRELLPETARQAWSGTPLPEHVRLLANFPGVGITGVEVIRAAETAGKLDRLLRARVAWVAARHDRAWYALDMARKRLKALGQTDDAIFALDGDLAGWDAADREALTFARKLTVAPAMIEDADVARLRGPFSDHEVAELIYQITLAAFFDRLTESAGLGSSPDGA